MLRLLLSFGCLLTVMTWPADAQQLDAKGIITKAIEAHGGEAALKKYKNSISVGEGTITIEDNEAKAKFNVVYQEPSKLRMTIDVDFGVQSVKIVQIMNGDKFRSSINDVPAKISDEEKAELKQAGFLQDVSMLYPLLSENYTLKKEKDEEFDGKAVSVVLVSAVGFKPVTAYFDQATGYLVRYARKAMGNGPMGLVEVNEVATMSDFKKIDGVVVPMLLKVTQNEKPYMTMKLTEVSFPDKIDPKLFSVDD